MGMNTKSLVAHARPALKCWTTCLLISACLPAGGSAEVLYTFTDLGTLGGASSLALGINDAGQVVGTSMIAGSTQDYHSFIYDNTGMHDLGNMGRAESTAYDINNAGQVVGYCYDDSGYRAFATNPTRDLGTLGSGRTQAFAINDDGLIVGLSEPTPGDPHLFSYSGTGPMRDLGSLGGKAVVRGLNASVNASGQIACTLKDVSGNPRAVRIASGGDLTTAVDLGSLDGSSPYSVAFGINDAGAVVGSSYGRPVLWPASGGMVVLDPLIGGGWSEALGINNSGQVVGWESRYGAGRMERAFIYENGTLRDLNSLVSGPHWTLERAYAINDSGQIVGFGTPYGEQRAFLLTPIPEPATLALIAMGGICGATRFGRRGW